MSTVRLACLALLCSACSDYGMTHYTIKYADDTGAPAREDEDTSDDEPPTLAWISRSYTDENWAAIAPLGQNAVDPYMTALNPCTSSDTVVADV